MAKVTILYPLRVYDKKLWSKLLIKVKNGKKKDSRHSINKEIEIALSKHLADDKKEE